MIKSISRLNTVGPVKVGSLKSQLHLRPSYDELLKETLVGDENRPSIENVIDRKATRYRLNQYGSQFDNKDVLDIQKKQELDRRGEVMKGTMSDDGSVRAKLNDELKLADTLKQHQSFIQEGLTEAQKQKEELAEKMRLWREQHEEMASAVSKSSYPAGVEVHSMVSADEMPELEPLEEGEEEDEREDDPVVEEESKAEDAYGYNEFKKRASELTPAYLASRPEEMKTVMDKLKGFKKIKDSVYEEFTELYNALINSDGDFIKKEHRLKLVRFYNDKVYYSVFHPRPKEKEDSPTVMDGSVKEIPAEV